MKLKTRAVAAPRVICEIQDSNGNWYQFINQSSRNESCPDGLPQLFENEDCMNLFVRVFEEDCKIHNWNVDEGIKQYHARRAVSG